MTNTSGKRLTWGRYIGCGIYGFWKPSSVPMKSTGSNQLPPIVWIHCPIIGGHHINSSKASSLATPLRLGYSNFRLDDGERFEGPTPGFCSTVILMSAFPSQIVEKIETLMGKADVILVGKAAAFPKPAISGFPISFRKKLMGKAGRKS